MNKEFTLSEFPDIDFSDLTRWDTQEFKRHNVSRAHADSIATEVKKRGFFSRMFRRR